MSDGTAFCPGPVSRRSFLESRRDGVWAGSVGFAGGAGEECSAGCVWQGYLRDFRLASGGPPHMEMYDMKPEAPSEYRGEFMPIKTNVPGHGGLRAVSAACEDRGQVQHHPLDPSWLCRSWWRPQTFSHRSQAGHAHGHTEQHTVRRLHGVSGA